MYQQAEPLCVLAHMMERKCADLKSFGYIQCYRQLAEEKWKQNIDTTHDLKDLVIHIYMNAGYINKLYITTMHKLYI